MMTVSTLPYALECEVWSGRSCPLLVEVDGTVAFSKDELMRGSF
jgi:hypothetical protein